MRRKDGRKEEGDKCKVLVKKKKVSWTSVDETEGGKEGQEMKREGGKERGRETGKMRRKR